jgi:hypothetical protein
MTVDNFVSSLGATSSLDMLGESEPNVGATLNVDAKQASGPPDTDYADDRELFMWKATKKSFACTAFIPYIWKDKCNTVTPLIRVDNTNTFNMPFGVDSGNVFTRTLCPIFYVNI